MIPEKMDARSNQINKKTNNEEKTSSSYDATAPQDKAGLSTGAGYGDDDEDDPFQYFYNFIKSSS